MSAFAHALSLVAIALLAAGCASSASKREADPLLHTAWRLVDLGGSGVVEGAEATLEFPEPGRAAGRATCNRFFASVTVEADDAIRFGPVGATRRACAEPLAGQETRYLTLLEAAERFAVEGDALAIYATGTAAPLRFARTGTSSRP